MLNFVFEIIFWCFFIYGIVSLIEDIYQNFTYNKIKKNVKLILLVKDVEEGIENYIRELKYGKNFYNNLVVVDLNSNDRTKEILEELKKETINLKILNEDEGKKYLSDLNIN